MNPTGPDTVGVRPVPHEWLAPQVVDSTRLDRLCADAELAARLRRARYRAQNSRS